MVRDLCKDCVHVLSHRTRSLEPEQHRRNTETVNGEDKRVSDSMVENMESEEIDNNVEDDCDRKFCNSRSLEVQKNIVDPYVLLRIIDKMRNRWSRHSLEQRGVNVLVEAALSPRNLCMMDPTWHSWF